MSNLKKSIVIAVKEGLSCFEKDLLAAIEHELKDQPHSIFCAECGNDLDIVSRGSDSDGDLIPRVAPCETCMEAKRADGFTEGKEEGAASVIEAVTE